MEVTAASAAAAAMIFMFSLNILFTVSSSLHTSSNSVQQEEGNKQMMVTDRKLTVDEPGHSIKFAAGHGAAVGHGATAGHGAAAGHGGSGGHGGGGGHGEVGSHGEGNGESSTPGTANVIPVYGAAGAKGRQHQSHKGGAHSHTCNLGLLTAVIFLPLFLYT